MKPRNYISGILVLMAITFSTPSISFAQHHHHHRPHWVDVHCCHEATRYVYFPEHNFYYDLEEGLYIYLSNGVWAFSYNVPVYYANIDLAIAPIIELDIHINRPYLHNHDHIVWYRNHRHHDYVRYYDGHRYYRNHDVNYGHGHKHGHYKKGHDNGNHYGHYKNHNNHSRGDRHGNGNHGGGNYKKYENKGKGSSYANRDRYEHRGSRSGNGRNGDGERNDNGRRR